MKRKGKPIDNPNRDDFLAAKPEEVTIKPLEQAEKEKQQHQRDLDKLTK